MEPYQTFANELEDLRADRVSIEELWIRYSDQSNPQAVNFTTILSFVEHYVTDDDIGAKDPNYLAMQETEFNRLLSHLRSGRIEKAKKITFLGSTG